MTTFVVTLFHPYTVSFDVPRKEACLSPRTPSWPATVDGDDQGTPVVDQANGATTSRHVGRSSQHEQPFLPKSRTGSYEIRFSPHDSRESVIIPKSLNTAVTPSEPHSSGWGKIFNLNQPASRARSPPPVSVLNHDSSDRNGNRLAKAVQQARGKVPAVSHERKFSDAGWTVEKTDLGNGGLFNAVKAATEQGILKEKLWLGTLSMPTDALDEPTKSSIAEKLELDYDTLTVFVDDKDFDGHYSHYCKCMLWPVLHYQIPDGPKSKAYEDHSWKYYVKVNRAFADCIAKNYKRGDVVWIHDYHLLLVPSMLRKLLPEAKIGFFLHIAFPSSEVFRCLATRIELLEGVLGANLIGFQTDEYCHHFLQTCSRLLGVKAVNHGVQLDNRFVNVGKFPIGIDPHALDQHRDNAGVRQCIKEISDRYPDKKIIVGRDKLDHIRGVRPKLLAYELFLKKHPEWRDKVVFFQVATSATEQAELEVAVADVVTRINSSPSALADPLLVFLKQDISYTQYLALLSAADCLMTTSLREGMNLTSHEYIYCQDGNKTPATKKHGALILSEFTGSASIFDRSNALLVNPWDQRECADAIEEALKMNETEKEHRWRALSRGVVHHTATQWFRSLTEQLDRAWAEQCRKDCASVPRLSYNAVKQSYECAKRRLFILDYEGTLASWGTPSTIIQSTPQRALGVLNHLIDDPRNTVYVMSARMPEEMERLFRQVPGLGLIAENGCFVLEAFDGVDFQDLTWTCLIDEEKVNTWKDSMRDVLHHYQERIEGTRLDERHCSFVLDYHNVADPASVRQQVVECADHINGLCQDQLVHVSPSDGQLVVEHVRVNKESTTEMIVQKLRRMSQSKGNADTFPDFLFVAGDSREDEHVFRWANKLGSNRTIKDVFTVSLAHDTNTEATATMAGPTGVLSILQRLATDK